MNKIAVKKLTIDNFKIYGSFSNLINPKAPKLGQEPIEFCRDIEQLNLGQTNTASFSVTRLSKRPQVIQKLEFHNYCCEGFLPLHGDVLMNIAFATRNEEVPIDKIEVFFVPRGTLVVTEPGVWHHAPFVINSDYVNVLVVLSEGIYARDCLVGLIPEEKQIEIEC